MELLNWLSWLGYSLLPRHDSNRVPIEQRNAYSRMLDLRIWEGDSHRKQNMYIIRQNFSQRSRNWSHYCCLLDRTLYRYTLQLVPAAKVNNFQQEGYKVGSQFLYKRTKWTHKTNLWHRGRNVPFPLFPPRETSIENPHAYFHMLIWQIRGSFLQATSIWSIDRYFHGEETGHTISTYRRCISLRLHLIKLNMSYGNQKLREGLNRRV